MIIVPGRDAQRPTEQRGETFTGTVWADPVMPSTDGTTINTVCFTPGARTFWHQHERGQLLHVVAGSGLICTSGEPPRLLRPGDIVWVPPMERHWHGGGPQTFMTHVAVSLGSTLWAEEVTDADYTTTPRSEGS